MWRHGGVLWVCARCAYGNLWGVGGVLSLSASCQPYEQWKNPGCSGFIWDYTTSCVGIIKQLNGSLLNITPCPKAAVEVPSEDITCDQCGERLGCKLRGTSSSRIGCCKISQTFARCFGWNQQKDDCLRRSNCEGNVKTTSSTELTDLWCGGLWPSATSVSIARSIATQLQVHLLGDVLWTKTCHGS